jgi:hypothetical protein
LTLIGATSLIIAIQFGMRGWDGSPMRAIPFVLLALILREGRRILRGDADERSTILFVIAIYSLAMLARVVLRVPSGGPYGGFMLPTSFLLFFYIFVTELPRLIARWMRDDQQEARARRLGAGGILLLALIAGSDAAIRYRTKYIGTVQAPRAHFLVAQAHDPAYLDALAFLRQNSAPGEAIAVFPEGSDLAFLSDLRMPLRHQIFLPGLMSAADEQKAITQLSTEPIRYILIANRPTREFGAAIFGRDYYPALGAAIERDYRIVTVCGRNRDPNIEIGDREFFIKILERKE